MSDCSDEHLPANPIYSIYAVRSSKSVAFSPHFTHFSCAMKLQRSVKPQQFILLLLIVAAATLGCRVATVLTATRVWGYGYGFGFGSGSGSESELKQSKPLDFKLFNSTLLKLAEIEVGERKQWQEIDKLLKGNRPAVTMRRFSNLEYRDRFLNGRSGIITLRSPEYTRFQNEFRQSLRGWARRKRFEPEIMDQLVDQVKVPIDKHNDCHVPGSRTKYESCAVVGNSGILLNKEYGGLIDSHEAVIRLNNARIMSYEKHVGSKTTFSFVNSNILHLCTRREDCFCHPYGRNVPIVMYMCQPAQFLDYVVCNASHRSPLLVTDPRFDMLCSRIVKYYSLKQFALKGTNTSFEQWNSAHDGSLFHYSSGMQAVTLALGVCDRVSLFGFGKSSDSKHHYHTNQKKELQLHDYEAEYEFYRDLVQKTNMIPFLPEKFRFPPVVIHS